MATEVPRSTSASVMPRPLTVVAASIGLAVVGFFCGALAGVLTSDDHASPSGPTTPPPPTSDVTGVLNPVSPRAPSTDHLATPTLSTALVSNEYPPVSTTTLMPDPSPPADSSIPATVAPSSVPQPPSPGP